MPKSIPRIGVKLSFTPNKDGDVCRVNMEVLTDDGSHLTSQMILDAVSDTLLEYAEFSDEGDWEPQYNS